MQGLILDLATSISAFFCPVPRLHLNSVLKPDRRSHLCICLSRFSLQKSPTFVSRIMKREMRALGCSTEITTTIAGTTLQDCLNGIHIPLLKELGDILLKLIGQDKEVKTCKRECRRISKTAEDIVLSIAQSTEGKRELHLSPALKRDLEQLKSDLQQITSFVARVASRPVLSRLANAERDSQRLREYSDDLDRVYRRFFFQSTLIHRMLSESPDRSNYNLVPPSTRMGTVRIAVGTFDAPSCELPPKPCNFFGRDAVVNSMVNTVLNEAQPRLAVLGAPGIGKTTIAAVVLHDPLVVQKFEERRIFVPCDRARSAAGITSMLATGVGVQPIIPQAVTQVLQGHGGGQPWLVILDNLESAWESADPLDRQDVESLLTYLSNVRNVALIVTMRGGQRPGGVQWTQPCLPPLEPLDWWSSRQLYCAISGLPLEGDYGRSFTHLLSELDGVPLAINLMATVAQCEPDPNSLFEQWKIEKTSMLSGAAGPLYSVAVSIRMSLQSARMQADPTASVLLSLMSLFPVDVQAPGLLEMLPGLHCTGRALSTLLQTALVHRDRYGYLHVLKPIRTFILCEKPLADPYFSDVVRHYVMSVHRDDEDWRGSNASAIFQKALAIKVEIEPVMHAIISLSIKNIGLHWDIALILTADKEASRVRDSIALKLITRCQTRWFLQETSSAYNGPSDIGKAADSLTSLLLQQSNYRFDILVALIEEAHDVEKDTSALLLSEREQPTWQSRIHVLDHNCAVQQLQNLSTTVTLVLRKTSQRQIDLRRHKRSSLRFDKIQQALYCLKEDLSEGLPTLQVAYGTNGVLQSPSTDSTLRKGISPLVSGDILGSIQSLEACINRLYNSDSPPLDWYTTLNLSREMNELVQSLEDYVDGLDTKKRHSTNCDAPVEGESGVSGACHVSITHEAISVMKTQLRSVIAVAFPDLFTSDLIRVAYEEVDAEEGSVKRSNNGLGVDHIICGAVDHCLHLPSIPLRY